MQIQQEKQYDLLRLIVEKMEIVSEADHMDEGVTAAENCSVPSSLVHQEGGKETSRSHRVKAKLSLLKLRKHI